MSLSLSFKCVLLLHQCEAYCAIAEFRPLSTKQPRSVPKSGAGPGRPLACLGIWFGNFYGRSVLDIYIYFLVLGYISGIKTLLVPVWCSPSKVPSYPANYFPHGARERGRERSRPYLPKYLDITLLKKSDAV